METSALREERSLGCVLLVFNIFMSGSVYKEKRGRCPKLVCVFFQKINCASMFNINVFEDRKYLFTIP